MARFKAFCTAALFCCAATFASANTIITDPGPGGLTGTSGDTTFGYDFTVGSSPIELTALGIWDWNQDGLTNPHTISLWDTAQNLLATAFVSAGTVNPLDGQFRYATIIPITLTAGTTYVLGATYISFDADLLIENDSGNQATFDPAVLPGDLRFRTGGGFGFPDNTSLGAGSLVGPNAQFRSVPDAGSTFGLLVVSLAILFGLNRFRSLRLA